MDGEFIYVADTDNHAIRRIDLNEKKVETLIGNGSIGTLNSKSFGRGSTQSLNSPWELISHKNKLYTTMSGAHQIWEIEDSFGRNILGNGEELHKNDKDPMNVSLAQPSGICMDNEFLYFTDSESSSIRKFNLNSLETNTITGGDETNPNNLFDYGDIVGSLKDSKFQHPLSILKFKDSLIVSDTYNHKIKIIHEDSVSVFAGCGTLGNEDSNDLLKMKFNEPGGLSIFKDFLYVVDTNNHCIRCIDLVKKSSSTVEFQKSVDDELESTLMELQPIQKPENEEIEFEMEIQLPDNSHLHESAPSKWKINEYKGRIESFGDHSCILKVKCGNLKEFVLNCQIFYCSVDLCLMKELKFSMKSEIGDKNYKKYKVSFS
jgi:hypothetical protein